MILNTFLVAVRWKRCRRFKQTCFSLGRSMEWCYPRSVHNHPVLYTSYVYHLWSDATPGLFTTILCFVHLLSVICRLHLSNDDCLEDEREDGQDCSLLYCVQQWCIMICTHMWAVCDCEFMLCQRPSINSSSLVYQCWHLSWCQHTNRSSAI